MAGRWYIVILVVFLPLWAMAQEADSTAVVQPVESVKAQPVEAPAKAQAKPVPKDTIYQATCIRIDVLNPIFEQLRTDWHAYAIEAAINVRLKNRFFPTVEFGVAGNFLQEKDAKKEIYTGKGQYARIGLDINPLKKHPEQRSCMLIGVRLGSGWQKIEPTVSVESMQGKWVADVWGELVAGVNVDIMYGLSMGWAVRMKFMFSEKSHSDLTVPYYIPGYGYRKSMNWGFDYYIGYAF